MTMSSATSLLLFLCLLSVGDGGSVGPSHGDETAAAVAADSGVMLEVVTPTSGQVVLETTLSSDIQLRVVFKHGSGRQGVSLYECKAVSENGQHVVQLTDTSGCAADHSPMGCMVEENGTVVSPVFEVSSLAEVGDVSITCSWERCATPNDPKCVNRCEYFTHHHHHLPVKRPDWGKRRLRRQQDESASHTITTTFRVLPSHVPRGHQHRPSFRGHHHHHGSRQSVKSGDSSQHGKMMMDGYSDGDGQFSGSPALLYLNPITCSLFLLVLCVFLALYVSFVRSLRRSVDDIKREIESQRLRDKFLVR